MHVNDMTLDPIMYVCAMVDPADRQLRNSFSTLDKKKKQTRTFGTFSNKLVECFSPLFYSLNETCFEKASSIKTLLYGYAYSPTVYVEINKAATVVKF